MGYFYYEGGMASVPKTITIRGKKYTWDAAELDKDRALKMKKLYERERGQKVHIRKVFVKMHTHLPGHRVWYILYYRRT
jgi:hypothetical protein